MNEFIVQPNISLTPQQMVMGVMGITSAKLIEMILENRGGQFDHLFVHNTAQAAQQPAAGELPSSLPGNKCVSGMDANIHREEANNAARLTGG